MFVSEKKKDQLFKDSAQCLSEVKENTMNGYLGKPYSDAIENLNKCAKSGKIKCVIYCKVEIPTL